MDTMSPLDIERFLYAIGEQLARVDARYAIVIVGGAALSLQRVVQRTTNDVDVIAIADASTHLIRRPDPLPDVLTGAIARVTRDFNLRPDWMNTVVAQQWRAGLPPGFGDRVEWRTYGGLAVGIASRIDLIFLKLFAVADTRGPDTHHYPDLIALRPSDPELDAAAVWVATQDVSPAWPDTVRKVVEHVRAQSR